MLRGPYRRLTNFIMINVNKNSMERASSSVYYRAFNLFPGNLLLDKWKESKNTAIVDIKNKYEKSDPQECSKKLNEVNSCKDAASWAQFLLKKYMENFETK